MVSGVVKACFRAWKYRVFKVRIFFIRHRGNSLTLPQLYLIPPVKGWVYAGKQMKNFSVLHNYQYTFSGVTSLIFGSSGFNPVIR